MNQQNFFMTYKKQLLVIAVLLPLLALGVYLVLNATVFRSRASGDTGLRFAQESVTKNIGQDVVVPVLINPGGKQIAGFTTEVTYDPALLEVQNDAAVVPSPNSPFGTFKKTVQPGKVTISAFTFNESNQQFLPPLTSSQTVATITFKTKSGGNTAVRFNNLYIVEPNNQDNISSVTNILTVNISGAQSSYNCVTAVSAASVTSDQNTTITITTSGLPNGSKAYAIGTNRGTEIPEGEYSNFIPNTQFQQTFRGSEFGSPGVYTRRTIIKDPSGNRICTSNEVTVNVTSPTPTFGAPEGSVFVRGQLSTRSLTRPVGTSLPEEFFVANVRAPGNITGAALVIYKQDDGWSCPSGYGQTTQNGVKFCFVNRESPTGVESANIYNKAWTPDRPGTYKLVVDVNGPGGQCSGLPQSGKTRCSNNDSLDLVVTQGAAPTASITNAPSSLGEVGRAFAAGSWTAQINAPAGIKRVGMIVFRQNDGWDCPSGDKQVAGNTQFCYIESNSTPTGTTATVTSKAWTPTKDGAYNLVLDVIDNNDQKCSNYTQQGVPSCGNNAGAVINVGGVATLNPSAQLFFLNPATAGNPKVSERVRTRDVSANFNPVHSDVLGEAKYPTSPKANQSAVLIVKVDSNNQISSDTSWKCSDDQPVPTDRGTEVVVQGKKYCYISKAPTGPNSSGNYLLRTAFWDPKVNGTYKLIIEATDGNGRKCSGWQSAFGTSHPESGVVRCDNNGNDFLTLTVTGNATQVGSGQINAVNTILTNYGQTSNVSITTGDQNADGKVDSRDFAVVFYRNR